MVNLLMRYYDPGEGRVAMYGFNISDVTVKSLGDRFGVVSQEILLFNGTVRDNIAHGRANASLDEIV